MGKEIWITLFITVLIATSAWLNPALVSATSNEDEEEDESSSDTPPAVIPQPQEQPLSTADQAQDLGVSVQDLVQKYGANRTLHFDATGKTLEFGSQATSAPAPGDHAVILTLDDNWKSQYEFAAPILENNHFNATYFIYCLGVEQGPAFMTAAQVRDLHQRGFDIESHSMTHPDLTKVSNDTLDFEIAESKQCLQEMVPGLNVSIFATPFATGDNNATVLEKIVNGGYRMARVGYGENFNINCNGWYVPANQSAGCQLYEPGTHQLKYQSRYDIPTFDVNSLGRDNNHDLNKTQVAFEKMLDDTIQYDPQTGKVVALPILVYHNFTNRVLNEGMGQSLLAESFAQQMQYLKDNHYVVLSMADLKYNPNNATFSIPKLDRLGYS